MGPPEPIELRPNVVRARRSAFLESLPSILAAIVLVGVGVLAGAALQRAATHESSMKPEAAAADALTTDLRDEVRAAALKVCRAQQELRRVELRMDCIRGRASKRDCGGAEGQYRMDPCDRYVPHELRSAERCPFPGSC